MAPFHCPFPDCEDSFLKEGDRYDHLISDHKGVACSRAGCEELFFDESSKKKHRALVHQPTASVTAVFGTKKYERKLIMTRDDTTKEFHCPSRGCDVAKAVPSLIQRHVKDAHTGDKKRCGIPRDLLTRVRKPGEEVPDYSSDEVVSSDEEEQGEGEEEAQRSQEQAQQNEDDEDRRSDEEGDRQDDDAMDIELGGEREERDSVAGDTQPILEKHNVFSVMGFHVLQPFQVLVCLDCQYAVRPGLALSHARTRGVHRRKRRLPDTGEFAEAISVLRDAGEPYYKPPRPVKPLPGLKIRDGLICEKCRYITGNETYMRGHFTAMHKGFDLRSNTRSCKMQRFFEKAEKKGEDRHWEVLEVDDTPVATTAVSKYIQENRREAAEKRKNGPVVVRGPETDRDLNYFLYKTRYLQVVGKADTQFLYSKAQIPKEDEPWLFPLVASVREYVVDFAFDHLENMHLSTRRWLNTQKGELNNEPFKRRQEKSSVIAAADLLCRVICIVMRSLHDEIPEFEIPLTTRQDVTSGDFFEALEKGEEHAEYIHPFVLSLFTSTPGEEEEEGNSEPLYCAVSRCILMTTLAEDGRFNRPNYISTTLTGHQYWMRLAAAYEINAQARGREHRELMVYEEEFKYYLTDGMPTPFSTNCVYIRLVAGIVMGGMGFGTIGWGPKNEYVTLDGEVLRISAYKTGVCDIVDVIEKFFYERVLRGIRFKELEDVLNQMLDPTDLDHYLKDNPRNMSMGYSFLFEKENGFQKFEFALLEAFMNPQNRSEDIDFFTLNADGTVLWKHDAVLSWFTDDAHFNKLLASGIHLNVPGVSRGTEISNILLTNTLGGDRGLHVINGLLTILVTYVKQQSMGHPIGFVTKHACHRLTYITVYWLVIARSLARHWAPEMFNEEEVETYTSHVFVLYGRVITSQQLSRSIHDLTAAHVGFGFGIAQHRQFLTAVLMSEGYDLSKLAPMDEQADPKDVIHEMNNHSKNVGQRLYGGSLDGFSKILAIAAARQEDTSRAHHEWLGLGDRRGLQPGQTAYSFLFGETQVATTAAKYIIGEMQAVHEKSTKAAVTEAMVDFAPSMQHALVASLLETRERAVSSEGSSSPLIVVHSRRLLALRGVLGDPTATWKCVEQGQMAQLMFRRKEHGLVILPTGGGKSVGATMMSQEEKLGFTLLCAPFRSLYEDYKLRLHKSGIPWTKYPIRDPDRLASSRIVLVMVEWFKNSKFISWMQGWAGVEGGLRRVIIDEAWVIFAQDDFRYACECIRNANVVGTQFIFLSATWPVGMEYLLWERFGFDNRKLTRVIRARSTARLEISIHVKKVEDDEVEATVLDFLENVQTLKSNERGIIFCTTIADAQHYASLLGIPCYHGQLTEQEKTVVFHNWIAGEDEDGFPCQTVSATGAMGQGVDFPGVRYVVHVQPPYTFTDYVQQMGRAGRDGKPAISILIHSRPPFATKIHNGVDFGGSGAMTDYVTTKPICWRSPISWFFDIVQMTCAMLAGAQLCAICQQKLNESEPPSLPVPLLYPTPISAPHGKGKGRARLEEVEEYSPPQSPIPVWHPTPLSAPYNKGKGRAEARVEEIDEYHPPSPPIPTQHDTPPVNRYQEVERFDSWQLLDEVQDAHYPKEVDVYHPPSSPTPIQHATVSRKRGYQEVEGDDSWQLLDEVQEQQEYQPPPPKVRRVSGDGFSGRSSAQPAPRTAGSSRAPQPLVPRFVPRRDSTASAASRPRHAPDVSLLRGHEQRRGPDVPLSYSPLPSKTPAGFKPPPPAPKRPPPRALPQAQAPAPAPHRPQNPASRPQPPRPTAGPSTSRAPRPLPGQTSTIQSMAAGHSAKRDTKYFRGTQVIKLIEDFKAFRRMKKGCVFEWFNSVGEREDFKPQERFNEIAKHKSMYCACDLYTKDTSDYSSNFKKGVQSKGAFYCWTCCVPEEAPFRHPKRNEEQIRKLGRGCDENEDVVKELVYLIWYNQQKVFDDVVTPLLKDGFVVDDLREYDTFKRWVFQKPEDDTAWMNAIEMVYQYGIWRGICE